MVCIENFDFKGAFGNLFIKNGLGVKCTVIVSNAGMVPTDDKVGCAHVLPEYGMQHRFWVLYDFGFLGCFDARTGENVFPREKTRIRKERTAFTSSPWAYQDKIFCLSEDGETFVFEAGDAYKLLHVNELDEMCMATPAIHDGSLLIRTISALYRIGKSKG